MKAAVTVSSLLVLIFLAGNAYSNDSLEFKAKLLGDQEVPPVDSRVRGVVQFEVNKDHTMIDYKLEVRTREKEPVGLLGAAGAHIHCAPVGENGPAVAFLGGVVSGGFEGKVEIKATLTDANIVNASCGATIQELVEAMRAGNTYANVHSVKNPSGEARGQIEMDD